MSIDFTEAEVRALVAMRELTVSRVDGGWEREGDLMSPPVTIPDAIMAPLVVRGLAEVLEDDMGVYAQLTVLGNELMRSRW
ncbi:hypothetical protein [Pleomorphomonas carboxyditropha]|uniref:Uncharacterized protein n=1 Tax=Pleomorphomonas carboxyditropha TaxID=2023338 RepID=A0A2G9WV72_9HYPH|nr:hypothetical protein [Pleomorphomonas carboxyditropha]PIO98611.1 hypothetical protein CJ014_14940 [Pleomorphomonas carboxyditropha]